MTNEELTKALKRAYNLGQIYWQQADSEYTSQHKKADVTEATFKELIETTVAALEAKDKPMHPDIKKLYEDYFDKCFRESSPPQRTWPAMMRGVRVEGDTVVISVKGGNDAARELCGALIEEMNR